MIKQILLLLLFTTILDAQTLVYENAIPVGTKNGSNRIFTLETSPNPIESLKVYKNGLRLTVNTDYILSSSTITYQVAPVSNDVLVVDYVSASTTEIGLLPNLVTVPISVPFTVQAATNHAHLSLPTSGGGSIVGAVSGTFNIGAITFSGTANELLQIPLVFPDGWIGDLSVDLVFAVASTGSVSIQARIACAAIGANISTIAFNAYSNINSISIASANLLTRTTLTGIPITNCQAGYFGLLEIVRDSTEALTANVDNNTGLMHIYSIQPKYTYDINELTQ